MKTNIDKFFIPCTDNWRDGYFIPVRNHMNHRIEREFLAEELKELYIQNWGEKVIYSDVFLNWYVSTLKELNNR